MGDRCQHSGGPPHLVPAGQTVCRPAIIICRQGNFMAGSHSLQPVVSTPSRWASFWFPKLFMLGIGEFHHLQPLPGDRLLRSHACQLVEFWTFAYRVVFRSPWALDLFIELYSHLFGCIVSLFCLSSCKSVHYLIITIAHFQNEFNFVHIVVWYLAMRCTESPQMQHLLNKMDCFIPITCFAKCVILKKIK